MRMDELLRISHLRYRYGTREEPTLRDVSFTLGAGEMVLLAGKSGSGKSTLLQAVSGILCTNGRGLLEGEIRLDGQDVVGWAPEQIGLLVGTVYQTPDDQLFAMTAYDEVAFALENRGLPEEIISRRVEETLVRVGLGGLGARGIHTLSGGQRQRLALASVLVTDPKLLLLDEPVSQMNPQGARDFLQLLRQLNRERGLTILLIEHRVHELAGYFRRILLLREGSVCYDGSLQGLWKRPDLSSRAGLRIPACVRLCRALGLPRCTEGDAETAALIRQYCRIDPAMPAPEPRQGTGPVRVEARGLCYRYDGAETDTLRQVGFQLRGGEITALMGCNGAGKSTLLNLLGGVTMPERGSLTLDGAPWQDRLEAVGYMRQEADLMLLTDTVRDEFFWNNRILREETFRKMTEQMELAPYRDDFPLALSKGQRLRVVLGAILARKPEVLLLDEPTTGQDLESLAAIRSLLRAYARGGGCVFFCTHDVELASALADRVLLLSGGQTLADGEAHRVLTDAGLLREAGLAAPPLADLCRRLRIPPCLTIKEVLNYVHAAVVGRE